MTHALARLSLVAPVLALAALSVACYDPPDGKNPPHPAANGVDDGGGPAPEQPGEPVDSGQPPPVSDSGTPPVDSGTTLSAPESLGTGVTYQSIGTGKAVLIVYGGYTATLEATQKWAAELVTADLLARGVGHVYVAQGPQEPDYASKEIANTKLRAHLTSNAIGTGAPFIFIVAHSSGSFVAHEALNQMSNKEPDLLDKIVYANLDGGDDGFDVTLASKLRRVSFVYGHDTTLADGLSANASAEMSYGDAYAAYGSAFEVAVQASGCNSGAQWCLHDLVITHKPHKADNYDLANDYTDFVNRPVTTEYIVDLANYLK
jgi:hypothetical protein